MSVITRSLFIVTLLVGAFSITGTAVAASVSPAVTDVSLGEGEGSEIEFVIFHDKPRPVEFALDFLSVDLGMSVEEMTFSELNSHVSSWLVLNDPYVVVEPGEIKTIKVGIQIPANEKSQVQTLGLRVIELQDGPDAINVQSGLVSLIFLTVGDDFTDRISLLDFSTSKKISSTLPVSFHATVRNEGQRILQPRGSVTIRNMFGGIVSSYAVNESERRIPNNQQRTFGVDWGEKPGATASQDISNTSTTNGGFIKELTRETEQFVIGFFKAELVLEPYSGGENITATTSVFIFPWRFILVVTVVFALFYGLVRILRKK